MYKFSSDIIFADDRNPGFLRFYFRGSFATNFGALYAL